MTQVDPMLKIRDAYLDLIAQTQPSDYRPLPTAGDALDDKALFSSISWCRRVFRVPVHTPSDAIEHAYHVARQERPIDLLLHRPAIGPTPVRVYEASSFFAAFVPLNSLNAADAAGKATAAAGLLLALQTPATFRPVDGDPRQRSYSTEPSLPAEGIREWRRRIDAVVLGEELALIVYKVTYDDMMTMVSDPRNWFEELRNAR